jgi:hypothetical protein
MQDEPALDEFDSDATFSDVDETLENAPLWKRMANKVSSAVISKIKSTF